MVRLAARLLTLVALVALFAPAAMGQASFVVTNTADSGAGSLRDTITARNGCTSACPGITFAIPGCTGSCVIALTSGPLPALLSPSGGYIIDGKTQPGFPGTNVVIDGSALTTGGPVGLTLNGFGHTIDSLTIRNFNGAGIRLETVANGAVITKSTITGNSIGIIAASTNGATISQNTISGNSTEGVQVLSSASGIRITQNSIVGNGFLGIDLDADMGIEVNDPGDPDTGGNQLQNHPVITSATWDGSTYTVSGTMQSNIFATVNIEFFGNAAPDGAGVGEGETYLGALIVNTDSTGSAPFTFTHASATAYATITATATGNGGCGSPVHTSEFSLYPLLAITKSASPSSVTAGQSLNFDITVTNNGVVTAAAGSAASGLQVVDTVPAGFTWGGTWTGAGWNCVLTGTNVVCSRTAGDLPPGATTVLSLPMTAPTTPGSYTNSATVSATNTVAKTTATAPITLANSAPVANPDSYAAIEDTVLTVAAASGVLANDTDVNGQALTASLASGPASGTLSLASDGSFTYTPTPNFFGTDTFTYTASDGSASSAPATVTITVTGVNDPPVAVNDTATTSEDTPVLVPVLSNDSDPDGTTPTVSGSGSATNGTVSCTTSDCTFTPNANFFGTGSFSYTITDGSATSTATATITVTAVNDPPFAASDAATTSADTPVTINVLANDSDVEGNTFTVTGSTNGTKGTVSCTAAGACTYTPTGPTGADTFTYTVTDSLGASSTGTVTVTVTAPVGSDVSILKQGPPEVPNGGPFGYVLTVSNAGPQTATNLLVTDPLPVGMTFVSASGIDWTCVLLEGVVRCTLGLLDPGMSSTINLQVLAPPEVGSIVNEATVTSDSPDPVSANNMSGVGTYIFSSCPVAGPTLLAPGTGSSVTSPVSFSWGAVAGAARYRLTIVSAGGTQEQLLGGGITTATATLDPGAVNWSVAAEFDDGCPTVSTSGSFTVFRPCPTGKPVATGPIGPVTTARTILTWTAVTGTVRYDVFVSFNGGTFQNVGSVPGSESAPALEIALQAGASVQWYVEAVFATGCTTARSETATFNASCFPPELSIPGEVTSSKPYEVRASIVSAGASYLFEESPFEDFRTISGSKQGAVDESGEFIVAEFEHAVEAPTPFFYRTRVEQAGCLFSDAGRIVVIPLPPPTATEAETVVQFGNEEEVRQELFIPSPTPGSAASYTFVATTDREWMRVEPTAGTIGPAGITLTVITNPVGLPVGTNTGTVIVTFTAVAPAKQALETTTTGSKPVSVTLVTPVTNKGKSDPLPESLIIPAVAHASGVNSEWQTDIRLLNLGTDKLKYALNLTVSGVDGTQTGKSSQIELASGQNSALNDVVKQWYGLGSLPGEGATGVLEIRPLAKGGAGKGADAIPATRTLVSLASSRTYNRTPQGTLGEYIPAIPFASFVGGTAPPQGKKSVLSLQQLAQSSAYRSNLGIVEASGKPVNVEVRFYDGEGRSLLTLPVSLKAGEHRQLNQVLAVNGLTNVTTARAEIEIVAGDGKIAAYAAVVDNVTGDPLQVQAVDLSKLGARRYVLPGIAHFNTGQARWRTDVQIFNAGIAGVTATLSFFPVGSSTATQTATLPIGPGTLRTLNDIVPTLFGATNTGGAIQISTPVTSELVVTGRTYDQREAGSYGQFMSAVTEDDAIGLGDRAMQVLQMEESQNFRSNLGIVEVSGKEVRVELTAFPAESRVTPRAEFTLKPNEFRQFNAVLKSLNAGTTYNARVALRVIGGDGKIVAYGSAVDNLTQDPTYIPGQ